MELVKTDNGKYVVLGEECHIVGEKPKAARYKEDYPQRETYYNAILMCGVHHKIIDDHPDVYTIEVLHTMKNRHEETIQQALQNNTLKPLIIKDSEFLTIVEKAQRAIGMEINRPAQLSNVKSELRVGDVQEAIGFSTNQGMTAITIVCSCHVIGPSQQLSSELRQSLPSALIAAGNMNCIAKTLSFMIFSLWAAQQG